MQLCTLLALFDADFARRARSAFGAICWMDKLLGQRLISLFGTTVDYQSLMITIHSFSTLHFDDKRSNQRPMPSKSEIHHSMNHFLST
jgi:hypothetical protein